MTCPQHYETIYFAFLLPPSASSRHLFPALALPATHTTCHLCLPVFFFLPSLSLPAIGWAFYCRDIWFVLGLRPPPSSPSVPYPLPAASKESCAGLGRVRSLRASPLTLTAWYWVICVFVGLEFPSFLDWGGGWQVGKGGSEVKEKE